MFKNLKKTRISNGISCEKMAQILGLSTKSAYSKKENGFVKFTLLEAKEIANYFNDTIEHLFFE
ncbi:helix-turn-helix transcriptional regulator [Niameybacter massiliensis]|uniref:Helix-turn-helix transcriptional regulator n=1 Tax=Holtiella tumoricola TaxID=3018743 RepID=A0AA42DR81_9FIRM|nr:helix-turn-helix transcriptional regulator [Holtiella tumoricola]MDA3733611.1 helix-turn-helix transcriptional regulator [Holtiella tumoricola]